MPSYLICLASLRLFFSECEVYLTVSLAFSSAACLAFSLAFSSDPGSLSLVVLPLGHNSSLAFTASSLVLNTSEMVLGVLSCACITLHIPFLSLMTTKLADANETVIMRAKATASNKTNTAIRFHVTLPKFYVCYVDTTR